jgi:hypothetical protein
MVEESRETPTKRRQDEGRGRVASDAMRCVGQGIGLPANSGPPKRKAANEKRPNGLQLQEEVGIQPVQQTQRRKEVSSDSAPTIPQA